MMYCPPRGFGYSLRLCFPSAPCFPRFLGKHARLGMSQAEPSARLLPAAPCHSRLPGNFWPPPAIPSPERVAAPSFLRFPIPGENTNRGVAGFDCFPGCCRQLLPPAAAAPYAKKSVTSVAEGVGQSFKRFISKEAELPPAPASCVKTLCLSQAQRQGWSHKGQVVFEG